MHHGEPLFETTLDITFCLVAFVDTNRYLFFGVVSKGWRKACGKRPTKTKVVTSDTSVSQLLASLVSDAPVSGDICTAAAELGRLDLLQVARAIGCPWNSRTCAMASPRGLRPRRPLP